MTEEDYTDLTAGDNSGEPLEMESPEYTGGFAPTAPGVYRNAKRVLVPKDGKIARRQKDGHFGFLFKLTSGVELDGMTRDVDFHYVYINTKPQDIQDFVNGAYVPKLGPSGKPLQVSDAAKYLRLFEKETKGLTLPKVSELIEQTLDSEVGVRIEWRERTDKTGEKDPVSGKDIYGKSWLKTDDFIAGWTNAAGGFTARNAENPLPKGKDRKGLIFTYAPEVRGVLEDRIGQKTGNPYKVFRADNGPDSRVFKASAYAAYFTRVPKAPVAA